MKIINKHIGRSLSVLLTTAALSFGCSEDNITVGTFDSGDFEIVNEVYCTIRNTGGPLGKTIEMRNESMKSSLYISLSKAATEGVDATLSIDETLLAEYNAEHKSDFALYPADKVAFEENGAIVIAPGDKVSDEVVVSIKPDPSLTVGKTYAIPVRVAVATKGIKIAEGSDQYMLFVKAMGKRPSTDKGTGLITICYVECNQHNPLNAGEWTMKNSGKPMIDIVNIFAANINYIAETGRIGVTINPNIQHILDNRDKYIKPLQDKGIRVGLTILGNHDGTGVANLSDASAREFAAELKSIVEAYDLDGVDFDDEWSDYNKYPMRPGCVKRHGDAYARLCYETKRAMPDKFCSVYYIGAVIPDASQNSFGFDKMIDGVNPGDFVDYSYYAQYGSISTGYTTIKGMEKRQWGPASMDLMDGAGEYNIDYTRKNGYGVQVIYDLRSSDAYSHTLSMYKRLFKLFANKLYDEPDVVFSGKNHYADWL